MTIITFTQYTKNVKHFGKHKKLKIKISIH